MSLKQRLFRSNMAILLIALLALIGVDAGVLILLEDTLEQKIEALGDQWLDSGVYQAAELVDHTDGSWQTLESELAAMGYELLVYQNGAVLYGECSEKMSDLIDELNLGSDVHTTLEILNYKNVTAVAKAVSDDNGTATILAAHFPEGQWWMQPFRSVFSTILSIVIVVGMIAAGVLLLLAAVFTRRLNKVVMEPLEILSEGAQRVENGNLTEPLSYSGETEFEQVCQAFNNMQATILSNQQRSQQAEEARRDMIAGISHDLRTPLTNVQGYIKGIMDGVANTPEKQQTYLQVAYDAAGEMDRLLQKLFDFSRMESGQMPFHFVTDDLTELTAAYIAQKEMAFSEGNIQFVLDARTMWGQLVSMDVDQIRRIFDNLLENSIKYAGVQPVIIRIAVYQQDGQVILDWQDNGKGVAEDKIEHIFDRFYRCDAARSEKGSGIGLYVVRYIMEQHGGSIIAENDKGLRLRLCFPERSRDGKNTDC